jgi:formylglycine-generating enzyme required for sulfatase activity
MIRGHGPTVAALVALALLANHNSQAQQPSALLPSTRALVTTAESPMSSQVLVPAGRFVMGMESDDIDTIVVLCQRQIPAAVVTTQQGQIQTRLNEIICLNYGQTLQAQLHREVALDAFYIDRFEVTAAQYQKCIDASRCSDAPLLVGADEYIAPTLPLVNVMPDEASAYCAWRGGRLPTEAEWEYAARGDDGRIFPWLPASPADRWSGSSIPKVKNNRLNHGQPMNEAQSTLLMSLREYDNRAYFLSDDSDGYVAAAPPGSFPFGSGPFGTQDQAGNVAEITADAFVPDDPGIKHQALLVNPWLIAAPNQAHVIRGGSWASPLWLTRVDVRDIEQSRRPSRSPNVGFRCAQPVLPSRSSAPR